MKKRNLLITLLLVLALVLGACGNQGQTNQGAKDPEKKEEATTKEDAKAAPKEDASQKLKDGTYKVEKNGHNGPINFEISVADGKISEIKVVNSYDTPGVSTKALLTDLPKKVIAEQSTQVDVINGATISSKAMLSAVDDAIVQAGGKADDFKKEVAKEKPATTDKEADIIVVGGGGAGLAAAITAAENGASVIVVEKAGYVGGNTLISGGIYNTPDEELQSKQEGSPGLIALVEEAIAEEPVSEEHKTLIEEVKSDLDKWKENGSKGIFDSPSWFALQTWNGGDKVADLNLVKELTYNAQDGLKWLSGLGWDYMNTVTAGAGSMYPRTHSVEKPLGTGYIEAYMKKIESLDKVEIVYNTKATELTKEGNRISGVKAEDKDGNNYTFKANKSVILTTGGFAGSKELVNKYNTSGKWTDLSKVRSSNLPAIEGDGIKMATAVDAALRDMDQIQLLYLGDPKISSITKATFQPKGAEGLIYVNKEGQRFVREDGRRDEISLAYLEQTDGTAYTVQCSDSGVAEDSKDLGGVPVKDLIADGSVFYGETLEEAAKAAGIDPVKLQETVTEFNQLVDDKVEHDQFGRSVFGTKLENGPWYIVPKVPAVHHTMGGVVINENCNVMDEAGNPIEGLFAAGEVVGGIHGGNRLGGNALVDTVVFGRVAGEAASK